VTKRRAIIGGCMAALFLGIGAWALGFFKGEDPQMAKLQEIGSQMWDRNLPDAQRDELRNQFRAGLDSMSEDQRRAFFDSNRDQWMGRMQQRMDEFFAASPADQQKRLDEILDRMVKARNSQQQNNSNRNGRGAGGNRGSNRSEAGREARSQRRLDRTTPKQRAQFTEFRKRLDLRAQQRGITPPGDQRGGWGGFPRGRS